MAASRKTEFQSSKSGNSVTPPPIVAADEPETDKGSSSLAPPPSLDAERLQQLDKKVSAARRLLLPNPDELNAVATQLTIPVVKKLSPLEYFHTHPTMRMTLLMTSPDTNAIEPPLYGVLEPALPALRRERIEPYVAMLYPIVCDTRPLTYKLMQIKMPPAGRKWDNWNQTRQMVLLEARSRWLALRSIPGGYAPGEPDSEAKFPEPVFPDWTEEEWLERSLGVTGQIIEDDTHDLFKDIRHLR